VISLICARHPTPSHVTDSPKPNIPPPSAYDPLPPPSPRDLGPPPPGYGRYADFDHGPGSGIQSGGGQPPRRNLDEVMCFKVKRLFARSTCAPADDKLNLSAVRRDIMPTIVRIVISREIGEGLIGRRGGSTTNDDVCYISCGRLPAGQVHT